MPVSRERCEFCVYWLRKGEEGRAGECRRYPPTPIPPVHQRNFDQERPEHYFPVALDGQWCGEFRRASDV